MTERDLTERDLARFAFDAAVKAVHKANRDAQELYSQTAGRGDRMRAYFSAWSHLLRLYSSSSNFSRSIPINNLPPELALQLEGMCEYLGRGIIPEPVADCAGRGNLVGPTEERDLKCAVAYVVAAKRGIVADPHPINTVKLLYGCKNRRSVQGWVSKYGPEIAKQDLGDANIIKSKMKQGGAHYSKSGRSQESIRKRSRSDT